MALIVVPFLGLIALQAYQVLRQSPRTALSQQLVAHSFEIILTAQSLRSALQDAERGQRGYLLTGQAAYIAPYDAAVRSVPRLLARLSSLTATNAQQQRQVGKVAPLIDAKLAELRRTIAAYRRGGTPAARDIIATNTGLDEMRGIENGIDALVDMASRSRSRRLAALIAEDRAADRIAMASALLVSMLLLSGLALAVVTERQLRNRNIELARAGELAREAQEEARRAEKTKGRFLATASHDLRQPLQAVSLLNGTLRRLVKDVEATEALRLQDESIGSMSKLLSALLDISKLEAGAIEPEPRIVPVAQVLATMEQEFGALASSKGLELQVAACEEYVHTDPALLEQILRNLVSNAIKYTRAGGVRLRAMVTPPWIDIEVIDTGIGIATDQLQLIGEEFYQIGVPSNSTREGYGLGLSIVRRLVRLLGLRLQVSSAIGEGSIFSVRLPRSANAPMPERPADASVILPPPPDVEASILLVEDDPDVRNATRMLLRTEGYRVTAVASLAEALLNLRQSRSIDLVVTDFHLVGETGVQVISRLRAELGTALKAVLMTGDTSSAMKDLGHDPNLRIVSKPVQAEAFLDLVRALLAA